MKVNAIKRFAVVVTALSVALVPMPARAMLYRHLFDYKYQCEEALEDARSDPGLAMWALQAECHWHPELGPNGYWWLY